MPRKKSEGFTEVELDVMRILWEKGSAASDDIRNLMPGDEKRKESTMRTILGIMERKGYVRHITCGRTFFYSALIPQEEARRTTVQRVLDKVFNGSPQLLLQCLLDSAEIDRATMIEIGRMLESGQPGRASLAKSKTAATGKRG